MAALRADAGYVTVAVPRACLAVVESLALEPVKRGFDWDDAEATIMAEAERADAVALGPGLGRSDEARELVARLLESLELPVVVDADALYGLQPASRSHPTVLTPHAGELARLLGRDSRVGRRASARGRASGCRDVRRRGRPEGSRTRSCRPRRAGRSSAMPARRRSRPRARATC